MSLYAQQQKRQQPHIAVDSRCTPFTPCLTPSPSLPSTPSTPSSPPLHPPVVPAIYPLDDSIIYPIDDPRMYPTIADPYTCNTVDPLITGVGDLRAFIAARRASTDSATSYSSRASTCTTGGGAENGGRDGEASGAQLEVRSTPPVSNSKPRTFRVSFAPPQLAHDVHMKRTQHAHDVDTDEDDDDDDDDDLPRHRHKRSRRSTSTHQKSAPGSRSGRRKASATHHVVDTPTPPPTAPVKYRFISVHTAPHTHNSPASSSSSSSSPSSSSSSKPTPTPNPDMDNTNTNDDDTPLLLLEEHLEDSEDEEPFEHGPTELPPRMYPGTATVTTPTTTTTTGNLKGWSDSVGTAHACCGSGADKGKGKGTGARQGSGHNKPLAGARSRSHEVPPLRCSTCHNTSSLSGHPSRGISIKTRSYPASGGGTGGGHHTGGWSWSCAGGGAGAGGGGNVVHIRGRRKIVGKIPASELEFVRTINCTLFTHSSHFFFFFFSFLYWKHGLRRLRRRCNAL